MGFGSRTKVKAASPHHQFVIALHSPDGIDETGLLGCHPERMPVKIACNIVQRTFSSPVWKQELKELRRFRAIVRTMRQDFSALQTVWRSERDSNPRSGFLTLSLDISVSCRWQNLSREFRTKTRLKLLQSVRF